MCVIYMYVCFSAIIRINIFVEPGYFLMHLSIQKYGIETNKSPNLIRLRNTSGIPNQEFKFNLNAEAPHSAKFA